MIEHPPNEATAHNDLSSLFDSPTGRLAELIHLLADVPLSTALEQVPAEVEQRGKPVADPLWVLAGALVRLRRPEAQGSRTGVSPQPVPA